MGMSQEGNGCCGGRACETTDGAASITAQPQSASRRRTYTPPVDVVETPSEYQVRASVPGATPEQIEITMDDGVLTLRAGVANRHEAIDRFITREYGVGPYERSFRVGEGINEDAVSADLKQGVLTVRLPKVPESQPRKVTVKSN